MDRDKKLCYVITPYDSKDIGGGVEVDFEAVYNNIIKKAVEKVVQSGQPLELKRSKDEKKAGGITAEFIKDILNAEVAIVDVSSGNTYGNANVFYELGLRHAFRPRISVIIAVQETKANLPFDIKDMRVIFYDHATAEGQQQAAEEIAEHIQTALGSNHVDSPVFTLLRNYYGVSVPQTRCVRQLQYEYSVKGCARKFIGVKAGDLPEIQGVDVWVNPENTDMEMGRMCGHSVSSLIRYHGALLDSNGWVKVDLIQGYLRKQVGRSKRVAETRVIVTEPGKLEALGVRQLLHVAAFQGVHGAGYKPVPDLGKCVTNALEKLQELNSRKKDPPDAEATALRSVLFPIFGIRTVGFAPDEVLLDLVTAACNYIQKHPDTLAERIYFQAYFEEELRLCKDVMERHQELQEMTSGDYVAGMEPAQAAVHPEDLVKTLQELKAAARELRGKQDLKGAIELLQAGMVEGRAALAAGNRNVALASEVADCFGMLGGNLIRQGSVSQALAVYRAGRDIEMGVDGLTMTYNTVNLLVTGLLDEGWHSLHDALPDIEKVITRLETRTHGEAHADVWAWADLGMCEFMRRQFSAAEAAYQQAARLGAADARRSMLDKLCEIRDRWPQDDVERAAFYQRITDILA